MRTSAFTSYSYSLPSGTDSQLRGVKKGEKKGEPVSARGRGLVWG